MTVLYLFDIDGTLLHAHGSGRDAFDAVFEAQHGVARASDGIRYGGKTDPAIIDEIFQARLVRSATDHELAAFLDAYVPRLRTLLDECGVDVLDGVIDTLAWLRARDDVGEEARLVERIARDGNVVAHVLDRDGNLRAERQRGAPVGFSFNQGIYTTNAWVVVKGTPNRAKAMEFIRVVSQPQYQARLAELTYFGPMNPDALPLIRESLRAQLPTAPANFKQQAILSNEWWAANEAAMIERWTKWMAR